MRVSVAFSGPAGSGINTCAFVLGSVLSELGYFVFIDKEYSSLIKGGNNLCVLSISDTDFFISKHLDIYVYFNAFALEKNAEIYTIGESYFVDKVLFVNQNAYALGLIAKLVGLDVSRISELFLSRLSPLSHEVNSQILNLGYTSVENSSVGLKKVGKSRKLFFGNEVISRGAIDAGLQFYSAYPMTPASSLMDVLAHDPRVTFFQGEDEIAVAMSMLGAKFAGKRSMCGTSGGGFALMTESIGYSNQAEIGGVYVLSQRAGPSTGTPTYSSQSDLHFALNASFGETFPIVLSPSDFPSAYNLIGKALNWSDIYQHPVIFLVDKTFSESYMSLNESELVGEDVRRGKVFGEDYMNGGSLSAINPVDTIVTQQGGSLGMNNVTRSESNISSSNNKNPNPDTPQEFARYEPSPDGISPWSYPGQKGGEFIASSYEHDKYGKDTEDTKIKEEMERKRFQKMETFLQSELGSEFRGFDVVNPNAKKFFLTYGIHKVMLESFIRSQTAGEDWGIISVTLLQPLAPGLKEFIGECTENGLEKILFVEQSYSGQFESLIRTQINFRADFPKVEVDSFRSTSLFPIFEETIGERV